MIHTSSATVPANIGALQPTLAEADAELGSARRNSFRCFGGAMRGDVAALGHCVDGTRGDRDPQGPGSESKEI